MLELCLKKERKDGDNGRMNRNVDYDMVSEYMFGHLKIDPAEVAEVDLNTGKYDTKHIVFKSGVAIDKYVSGFPDTFSDYYVQVNRMTQNEMKVSFKSVPNYVPDEEILNLCALYGDVEGKVSREKVSLKTQSG